MSESKRISKDKGYLEIAKAVSLRSTCLRRCYGAIIVKNDCIISEGYNGAPRKCANCDEIGRCERQVQNIPAGQRYELCRSVHAEANAIIHADFDKLQDSTLYLYGRLCDTIEPLEISECCDMCKRFIINAGIKYIKSYTANGIIRTIDVHDWIHEDRKKFSNDM